MVRSWLQLFRAQTYPATLLCVMVPYLYMREFDLLAFILLLLAFPMHFFSFGHNSVMDYFYDKSDPFKQHHPLVDGRIRLFDAHKVVQTGLTVGIVAAAVFCLYAAANKVYALLSLLLYVQFGHAYNDGLDRSTVHSWVPISLCFVSLGAFGWFMGHESLSLFGVLLLVYIFFNILYQIAWEGNLKDVGADKVNMLSWLGVRGSYGGLTLSARARAVGWAMKLGAPAAGAVLAVLRLQYDATVLGYAGVLVGCALTVGALVFAGKIMGRQLTCPRDRLLVYMSFTEICTIYAMLFIALNFVYAVALAVYGLAYFFLFNIKLWSFIAPKV